MEAAKESLNKHGFFDLKADTQTPVEHGSETVSTRRRMALEAKPQNTAARTTGGNTYHCSILGNPVRIASSQALAFQFLHWFLMKPRLAATLSGFLRAAEIHTHFIDLRKLRALASLNHLSPAYLSYGRGIFADILCTDHLNLVA